MGLPEDPVQTQGKSSSRSQECQSKHPAPKTANDHPSSKRRRDSTEPPPEGASAAQVKECLLKLCDGDPQKLAVMVGATSQPAASATPEPDKGPILDPDC